MAFIDQEKAIDRVVRAELWKCLAERGIFGELLRAIQSLYICSQAAVRTREGETDWFEVKCGLRQGCVLSPLLFIIFLDNIMKRANQEENSIEELMFADDIVLIAEDQIRLQETVSNLGQQCKNYGMRISRDKTGAYLCSPVPMFPGTHAPRYLCSPVPMLPGTYVPRYLCSPNLCSPNLCSPVPMFPGTYVPRYAVNDSSTPPRLIFLSLQVDMIIVIFFSGGYRVCTLDAGVTGQEYSRARSSRLWGITNHGENNTPRDQSSWCVSSANFPPVQK